MREPCLNTGSLDRILCHTSDSFHYSTLCHLYNDVTFSFSILVCTEQNIKPNKNTDSSNKVDISLYFENI